ncbi:hypothetical protein J5N97_009378 [Dioscorea zingiberensis]|uniref:Uncharacterized protein n=1 Tax=Dioscorea zingiberensis TaxID=325984 RepID=A0A9D5HLS0_9LILI|nr:hypothetical protein J5N97_009378 [Dioscorea zingiberensis]
MTPLLEVDDGVQRKSSGRKATGENRKFHSSVFLFHSIEAAAPQHPGALCSRLHASAPHRDTFRTYAAKLYALVVEIAGKIANSIGVPSYPFEEWPCQFRMNKYSFTKEIVGSSGVQIHT